MDIGTGLTIAATSPLLRKLLGPTADYLGGEVRNYTEKGMKNLVRVFGHAAKTLGGKLEEPGQVPPKVLKGILEEGYFCQDELAAQYFGGVLASSRSEIPRDDRGTTFLELIGRLSSYQVRTHYIFYTLFKKLCFGRKEDLGKSAIRGKFKIFIPIRIYAISMDCESEEQTKLWGLLYHIMHGMHREDLIEGRWSYGGPEDLKQTFGFAVPEAGIIFCPSGTGIELYLWAHGYGDFLPNKFLSEEFPLSVMEGVPIITEIADPSNPERVFLLGDGL